MKRGSYIFLPLKIIILHFLKLEAAIRIHLNFKLTIFGIYESHTEFLLID